MSFLAYDLIFLAIFLVFFSVFLYTRKHNLKREGLLFLYRTKWGIKIIDSIGKKYKKTLSVLSYVCILSGYLLMAGAIYLIYNVIKIYVFSPAIVRAIKVPPIIPLVPYLPQVFRLEFLPPFYFTYWIVIIAVIAITHEMAHGILMRLYNVKIKSTGFAFFPWFFPVFPAAFVEQDEKSMNKSTKFHQLAILSAGTFANVVTAALFLVILFGFFSLAFAPSGVVFDTYATSTIPVAAISLINGITLNNGSYQSIIDNANEVGFSELTVGDTTYLVTKSMLENQEDNEGLILAYNDAPAIRANLSSIITEINGIEVNSIMVLQEELVKYAPGDNITIQTKGTDGFLETEITLGENPLKPGAAWVGIGFYSRETNSLVRKIVNKLTFKDPNVYYEPKVDGISIFFYNLLWWVVIISISVALVNMLPVGLFDGGKFFYLTVLGITGSKKFAERAFKFTTWFFLASLLALMIFWFVAW